MDFASALARAEVFLALLVLMLVLTGLARRLLIPYPILLVLGGLAIAFVPGIPPIRLDPDVVFLVFLPPILWAAAYFTSIREFRRNLRAIGLLAIGLVVVTTVSVGYVAHAIIPGISWAAAFALGAIVSPPDAVAATAVLHRVGVSRQLLAVLEGESLVNDATALVLYRAAVAAIVTGAFSLWGTVGNFGLVAVGGAVVGLAVAWVTRHAIRQMPEIYGKIAITLLAPYVAWVGAERIHVSGVLACVAGGVYLRQHLSTDVSPTVRLEARSVWELVLFALNGMIFILIGLQLGPLRAQVMQGELRDIIRWGLLISLTAIVVRFVWVPIGTYVPRLILRAIGRPENFPKPQAVFLTSWTAMRGVVTLAAALSLPLTRADGSPLPHRSEIILVSFVVILATLLVQGLSLTPLARWLGLSSTKQEEQEREATEARARSAEAALRFLDRMANDPGWPPTVLESVRGHYERRLRRFGPDAPLDPTCGAEHSERLRQLRAEAHHAERRAVIDLRDRGEIGDDVLLDVERELDVEAMRNGIGHLVFSEPEEKGAAWQ